MDLIFSDPPYEDFRKTKIALEKLLQKDAINKNAKVIIELSSKDHIQIMDGFFLNKKKIIGDTQFCIYCLN